MTRRLAVAAEGLLVASLCVAPWPLGCAPDPARYALTAVLLLAATLWLAAGGSLRPLLPTAAILLLGFLQLALGISVSPVFSAEAVLVGAAMFAVLAFVRERASERPAALRIAAAALVAGLAQAAYGAYSWSVSPTRIYGVARADVTMPFGSFVNHNHFAGFTEMAALLALGLALGHARRARQLGPAAVGLGALALALAASHLASRSRGGLIAFACGSFLLGWLSATRLFRSPSSGSWGRALGIALGGAGIVLLFAWLAISGSSRRYLLTILAGPADSSASYRLETGRATLRLVAAHPILGSGLGAYEDAIPRHKRSHGDVRTTHAESDALELLAEGGLVGAGVVVWLALVLLGGFRARIAPGRGPLRKGIAVGAMSGAAALAVHSLFDFNLRIPSNALLFVVLLGLATAPSGQDADKRVARGPTVALVMALLSAVCVWRALGARSFEDALHALDPNVRIERLDQVARLHPYLAEAWRERGVAWRELGASESSLRLNRLSRAATDLSVALRLRPDWAAAWADRGWVRGMLGELGGARADLERALALDPTHPGILLIKNEFDRQTRLK